MFRFVTVAVLVGVLSGCVGTGATPAPTADQPAVPTTDPTAAPALPTAGTSPDVFTEIAPGEFADIPDWPLGERTSPRMVWTGTELIAWGAGTYGSADDGAAFDLANGTWRVIAEAPLSPRSEHAVVWNGTEMLVWGGRVNNTFFYDGAAYDPATDTWRPLPSPPAAFDAKDPVMVWTGDEAVVMGVTHVKSGPEAGREFVTAAAYDPVTDGWRALADAPFGIYVNRGASRSGDSIVVADVWMAAPDGNMMARYDLAADSWSVADIGSSAAVVGVPGSDGTVSTFVNLPSETGAPVQLIDSTGSPIAELPAFPAEPDVFGDEISAFGLWVGEEAVFELWSEEPDYAGEQIWALNPDAKTWRRLDADTQFPRVDPSAVAAGDLLLMWNRPNDVYRGTPRMCCVAPPSRGGSIYRVGTASPSEAP